MRTIELEGSAIDSVKSGERMERVESDVDTDTGPRSVLVRFLVEGWL